MKHVKLFEDFLFEQELNEIGDSSARAFPWKPLASYDSYFSKSIDYAAKEWKEGRQTWIELPHFEFEISGEKAVYTALMACAIHKRVYLNFAGKPKPADHKDWSLECSFHFNVKGADKEDITNLGEHFRLMASLAECAIEFIDRANELFRIDRVDINAKADDSDTEAKLDSKRGRLYLAYVKGSIRKLKGDWTAQLTDYGVTLRTGRREGYSEDTQSKMFYNR